MQTWPEQAERETRWCDPDEAAGLVVEPELPPFSARLRASRGRARMTPPRRPNVLLRVFRSLMPRDERFIERFCAHSRLIVPAAEAFRALMSDDGRAAEHVAEINRLEDEADRITRENGAGDPSHLRDAFRPLPDPRPHHRAR